MTNVKKMTTLCVLSFIIIMLFSFISKPESDKGFLTMRTTEGIGSGTWDFSITIVYEDGKMEKTQLEEMKVKDLSSNLVLINKTLNSITSKGYKLISTAGCGGNIFITTYTFIKE